MNRETQRRLALLFIVGTVAAGWAIALHTPSVTPAALASSSVRAPAKASARPIGACPFPASLRPAFEAAARDASLPPALLYAVAKVESNLRADAQSEAGARGLLQVMPETGRALALNIDEPHTNVLAGARYLRQLFDRFGSSDVALAAYNAGPTAVARAGGAPSIAVQRYISNVNLVWHSVAGCH
jgi:soluble lytic murein transglycosylase-like protein